MHTFKTLKLVLLCAFVVGVVSISIQINTVDHSSMSPTMSTGDRLVVNKLAYIYSPLKRGDVIVSRSTKSEKLIVKRVVAFSGEAVTTIGKTLYINDIEQNVEELGSITVTPNTCEIGIRKIAYRETLGDSSHLLFHSGSEVKDTWVVPPGEVFVMGDNRSSSSDSRSGYHITKDTIVGRVEHIFKHKCDES